MRRQTDCSPPRHLQQQSIAHPALSVPNKLSTGQDRTNDLQRVRVLPHNLCATIATKPSVAETHSLARPTSPNQRYAAPATRVRMAPGAAGRGDEGKVGQDDGTPGPVTPPRGLAFPSVRQSNELLLCPRFGKACIHRGGEGPANRHAHAASRTDARSSPHGAPGGPKGPRSATSGAAATPMHTPTLAARNPCELGGRYLRRMPEATLFPDDRADNLPAPPLHWRCRDGGLAR